MTLGIPIAAYKTEGPAVPLTFLGIEVNTIAGELRFPNKKRQRGAVEPVGGPESPSGALRPVRKPEAGRNHVTTPPQ